MSQLSVSSRSKRLSACVDGRGRPDFEKYRAFCKWNRKNRLSAISNIMEQHIQEKELPPPPKRVRTVQKHAIMFRDETGELKEMTPQLSNWYMLYINQPQLENPQFSTRFRRRFRLPYPNFKELLGWVKEDSLFQRWTSTSNYKKTASPIELLVLGSLRYIGRGFTFDDIAEATAIDEETHRQFFHIFIEWGSGWLFDHFVVEPTNAETAKASMELYAQAGMNGCVNSADATNIAMEKCSHYLNQAHRAFKLNLPARTFNISSNHSRRIHSSTRGHPAKWNDKTIQMYDVFLKNVYEGKTLQDVQFTLYEKNNSGEVVTVPYKGVWTLVDNGYVHWSTMIPPFKMPLTRDEIRWSEWAESMRKDVECTFGILKGRFRVLKAGIRLHSIRSADRIFLTCCALHNYLLEIDGLEKDWKNNGISIWEGEMGNHDPTSRFLHPAFAREELMDPAAFPTYDVSGMGRGNDAPTRNMYNTNSDGEDEDDDNPGKGKTYPKGSTEVRVVRELDFDYFRDRLVENFAIVHARGELVWPSRTGEMS